jgi:hypothetical protein
LGDAHSLWQGDAETIKQSGLGGVWPSDAAQVDLAVCCGWQDDIVGLDARKLFKSFPGPRGVCHISRHFHGSTKARKPTRI